ncbi:hypothetical protein L226DRAFT_566845 [Lentinus tigrinus ALCF2SS1-7]|uniref:Uncharacterized protein n=1 Tax=Lentinus tigrinus ALCF2SS1-6 TaxID=1328759 RepID=A0A5C2SSR2_9APHY|nr:hypothetical protein L227DRAFT_606509 [Lentinus tigrinus ALCF2SS1-6]RPD80342.1 hypothetical protein L226DRAFT_566845 [Lentinus tigrinus ALCF2SS1-7]
MPSLRRTLSSPSVRSSPYSYPSLQSANSHPTRAGDRQPRRSSGSDTSNRRVLADIDWWIVQDGQREVAGPFGGEGDPDEQVAAENEQVRPVGANVTVEDAVAVPPPAVATTVVAASAMGAFETEIVSSPLWDVSTDDSFGSGSPEMMSPLPQFAALSIAPRMPLRRHASESSQSSVDSTPESSPYLPTYMDILRPAAPAYPSVFASSIGRRPTGRAPPLASRSVSYSAVEFQLSNSRLHDNRFDDIVPSYPPFFSSTMGDNDIDDLFF